MESHEYLIPMTDGGLIKYEDDCYKSCEGCPTCGYGEEYTRNITMYLHNFNLCIEILSGEVIDQGLIMSVFLNNVENIKNMTENQFVHWFKDKIQQACPNRKIKATG